MDRRLMDLFLREGANLAATEVLVQAAADVGLDPDEARERLAGDADARIVQALARGAVAHGVQGVPTFVFAQQHELAGAQRPEHLARAIAHAWAEGSARDLRNRGA